MEEPIANSSLFSFPNNIAPSFHKLLVTVDSYGGIKFESILLDAEVNTPLVQNISLTPIGIPSKSLFVPLLNLKSEFSADLIAISGVSVIKAFKDLEDSIASI